MPKPAINNLKPKPNSHSRVRSDHSSELAEDYVEAIYAQIKEAGFCRAVDLSKKFAVSHVTVKRTLERLERDQLVITEPRGPVTLTSKGLRLATASAERHAIVFRHLLSLGVSRATAEFDAEGIEHHVSNETLAAMKALQADQTDEVPVSGRSQPSLKSRKSAYSAQPAQAAGRRRTKD